MAAQKKPVKKSAPKSAAKAPAKKKTAADAGSKPRRKSEGEETPRSSRLIHQIMPFIWVLLAVFIVLCYFIPSATGALGGFIKKLFFGLFAGASYAIPVVLIIYAIFWKKDVDRRYVGFRTLYAALATVNLSVLLHGICGDTSAFSLKVLFEAGTELKGGGAIGGLIGSALRAVIGYAGLYIVSVTLLLIMGMFLCGLTPHSIALFFRYRRHVRRENARIRREEREKDDRRFYENKPEVFVPDEYRMDGRAGSIDLEGDDDLPPFETDEPQDITERRFEDVLADDATYTPQEEDQEILPPVNTERGKKRFADESGVVDLEEIFGEMDMRDGKFVPSDIPPVPDGADLPPEDEGMPIERKPLNDGEPENADKPDSEPVPEKPKKKPAKYIFPPISLLEQEVKQSGGNNTENEKRIAVKLIDTLESFKVKAKLVDIAHGPSITRYELVPDEGVRVRAIANLVDDIGLALATSGVRIEAPIPGKAAIGIEVPNKDRATVHLRTLIEKREFRENPSRLNVALGVDVAGDPQYLDIAKMPHLLIAGTTGSGKSVCISAMLISILYKATPDEVKMIIIDPKKIDFGFYNGLPHLLVPVVTDPKKAAGSLQWAVNEMERRYGLIESAGVRDIYNYNLVTKEDPTFEFLPQIVIVIDEFADLMQTAPDAVEDCVCRLAQKARAAGIHLVIGTQRPSVDVITGLIKSNFPSRIALTVKSQVDSRTMIDMAGAEKLIGRGDMLYAPVGSSKPVRVQGAFLTDQEIAAVTGFIKAKAGETEYSDEVIDEIDREAAKCGVKKGSGGVPADAADDDGETDPMLKSAIELAVDAGKISTSLIQRKLSLGYGRAAKLIDKMEQMAIVGPQDGNKPRQVLLTRQEYMEMVLNNPDM